MSDESLFKRYMRNVICEEGDAFVPSANDAEFSAEERAEIRAMADEIYAESSTVLNRIHTQMLRVTHKA